MRFLKLFGSVLCIVLAGLLIENLSGHRDSDPSPQSDDSIALIVSACHAAQNAVRPRMLTPGAARFPDCSDPSYEMHTNPDHTAVYISGVVDSQNAFGALLRRKWVAILRRKGMSHALPEWTVEKMDVIGP